MRLLALLTIAGMTSACAITNYPVIYDDDQTGSSVGFHIVNTSGEAIIVPEFQIATIWPDGTDELLTWVNQDASGNQTLMTRNNFCAAGAPCSPFAGFVYINPDATGCSVWKADNPVVDDVDIFDGKENPNCSGARSLGILLSTGDRLAEGGKDARAGRGGDGSSTVGLTQTFVGGVTIGELISALGQLDAVGEYGDHTAEYSLEGWKVTTTPDNFGLYLNDTRFLVDGMVFVLDVRNRKAIFDFRTGNMADVLNQIADWVDANGDEATLSVSFAGLTPTFQIGLMGSDHYRAMVDRLAN